MFRFEMSMVSSKKNSKNDYLNVPILSNPLTDKKIHTFSKQSESNGIIQKKTLAKTKL